MTSMRRRAVLTLVVLACIAAAAACTSNDAADARGFYAEVHVDVQPQPDDPLAGTGAADAGGVIRWWYAAEPGRWRWEIEVGGSPIDAGTLVTVFDGADYWSYDDRSNAYQRAALPALPAGTVLPPTFSAPVGPANAESVDAFMEQWRERSVDGEVRLGGAETVLGRPTQIVEIRPAWHSSSSSAEAPAAGEEAAPVEERETSGGVIRAYIDPDRMFIMRWAVDGEGDGQSYSAGVTRLDYDTAIDEARFTFEPPSAARELTASDGASCQTSIGPIGGASVPTQPGFLRPVYLPPGYAASGGAGSEEADAGCATIATWTLLESGDGGYLLLRQRERSSFPDAVRDWQTVDVAGRDGYRQSEDGIERLVWRDGEIVAMLEANALPFEELLRTATSSVVEPRAPGP